MESSPNPVGQVWTSVVNLVKDRVNHRTLWETLEQTVGIAIEGDTFVVGIEQRSSNMASLLTSSDHRNAIERAIRDLTNRSLNLRVIEGTTIQDWENAKAHDARVKAMRASTYQRKDREAAEAQSWESVYDQVARNFSSMHLRALPQSKARHMRECIALLVDAMDRLYPEKPDDLTERHLARIIDRIAGNAEVPPAIVAFELQRMRAEKGRT